MKINYLTLLALPLVAGLMTACEKNDHKENNVRRVNEYMDSNRQEMKARKEENNNHRDPRINPSSQFLQNSQPALQQTYPQNQQMMQQQTQKQQMQMMQHQQQQPQMMQQQMHPQQQQPFMQQNGSRPAQSMQQMR